MSATCLSSGPLSWVPVILLSGAFSDFMSFAFSKSAIAVQMIGILSVAFAIVCAAGVEIAQIRL